MHEDKKKIRMVKIMYLLGGRGRERERESWTKKDIKEGIHRCDSIRGNNEISGSGIYGICVGNVNPTAF